MPPKKRKLWSDEAMESAMIAVSSDKMACAAAAKKFGVPRKSLENRVKGRVKHGVKPGPSTTLTAVEEAALVQYIKYLSERGFPLTKKICKAYAWAVAKQSGRQISFNKQSGPSEKWWRGFRKRNSGLALRRPDCLDRGRARMANQSVMNQYFSLLKETLDRLGISDRPDHIYNCDESGVALDPKKERVIVPVGTKHVYSQQMGGRDHITVHCCVSADGKYLPPMIIFEKNYPSGAYTRSGPENSLYAKSPNGYMDGELYCLWFIKIFIKYATKERPILLIQDGHGSHITPELIDHAKKERVEILCLPPHTTHILQPLDKVIYGPLKKAWSSAVTILGHAEKSFILSKNDFARVFRSPFESTFNPTSIKNSFKKTGIFPFDPDAIDKTQLYPSDSGQNPPNISNTTPECSVSNAASESATSSISTPVPLSSPDSVSVTPIVSSSRLSSTSTSISLSSPSPSENSFEVSPCPSCGCTPSRNPASNPLVAAGLIPSHLHDILAVTNYVKVAKKRTRVITKARVITNEEYMEEIRAKEKKKEEEELKKEERKRKREQRREEIERKKQEKIKKAKTSISKKGKQPLSRCTSTRQSKPTDIQLLNAYDITSSDSDPSDNEVELMEGDNQSIDAQYQARKEDSDEEDDEACFKCGKHDPPSDFEEDVNWFRCDNDSCERWYHSFCLEKKERPYRGYHWDCPICISNNLD